MVEEEDVLEEKKLFSRIYMIMYNGCKWIATLAEQTLRMYKGVARKIGYYREFFVT